MNSFWKKLKKPFLVLAPMDDVTDVVFREIVAKAVKPDVFFTEFTNVEALESLGRESQIRRFRLTENQHPIVAQIWGTKPENYFKTVKLVKEMGFDGVDINMGCPQRTVLASGACSALIKNHDLAKEIILATKEGAGNMPVSVKTRLGFDSIDIEGWLGFLLSLDIAALTIHGRTVRELSKVPIHWNSIEKVVELRNTIAPATIIIGNGDVKNRQEACEMAEKYGVDGVMIGRGVLTNLWVFEKIPVPHSVSEKIAMLLAHAKMFTETWGDTKNFEIMKKFFKVYISGFEDAHLLREKLMSTHTYEQVKEVLANEGKL